MDTAFETLDSLAREHGDAFYLVHPDRFRANLRALLGSFRAVYPRTTIGYSYKANYLPLLGRIADEEGCHAEVVSPMECRLARRLGVPGERIIFNGPLKSEAELEEALSVGVLVNVDSLAEVESIERIARRRPGSRLRVGVRCHVQLGEGHESRFGLADDELAEAHDRLRRIPECTLEGLHLHSSASRDRTSFHRRAEVLVSLARKHFPGAPPAYVDLGGGFYGPLPDEMRYQFDTDVPSWDDVARAVGTVLSDAFPGEDAPELVIEPGVAVVADVVEFVCRVAATKRIGSRRVAIVTGSIQEIKARANPINLPLRILHDPERIDESPLVGPTDVTGYTCLEDDVLAKDVEGDLRVGDLLVVGHVGAYTSVFKPPFIRPAPAMLATSEGEGGIAVVRQAETLDDVLATYEVPSGP